MKLTFKEQSGDIVVVINNTEIVPRINEKLTYNNVFYTIIDIIYQPSFKQGISSLDAIVIISAILLVE